MESSLPFGSQSSSDLGEKSAADLKAEVFIAFRLSVLFGPPSLTAKSPRARWSSLPFGSQSSSDIKRGATAADPALSLHCLSALSPLRTPGSGRCVGDRPKRLHCLSALSPLRTSSFRRRTLAGRLVFIAFRLSVLFGPYSATMNTPTKPSLHCLSALSPLRTRLIVPNGQSVGLSSLPFGSQSSSDSTSWMTKNLTSPSSSLPFGSQSSSDRNPVQRPGETLPGLHCLSALSPLRTWE